MTTQQTNAQLAESLDRLAGRPVASGRETDERKPATEAGGGGAEPRDRLAESFSRLGLSETEALAAADGRRGPTDLGTRPPTRPAEEPSFRERIADVRRTLDRVGAGLDHREAEFRRARGERVELSERHGRLGAIVSVNGKRVSTR